MTKPRDWKITEELVDVLRDYDLSLDEAKARLADAYSEYDCLMEERWQQQQERLMESGGPDDSAYRRDLIAAGRGHLLP